MTKIFKWDDKKQVIIPGSKQTTLDFCARHFIECAKKAITKHGNFFVALSGGSTPKAVYELLATKYKDSIPWNLVYLFWSDERSVPPTDASSNYLMAMSAGFSSLKIPHHQIFRMQAESSIESQAHEYEKIISSTLKNQPFDLIILGMGEDGHTASLFPNTKALNEKKHLVVANYVDEKKTWRMTLTFKCINKASNTVFYVIGNSKKETLKNVFLEKEPEKLPPCMLVGTKEAPAFWIVDEDASSLLSDMMR